MYSDSGHCELMDRLNQVSKTLVDAVVEQLVPCDEDVDYSALHDLYAEQNCQGRFFYLMDGSLRYERDGKVGFYYDSGDIVGLENQYEQGDCRLSTDFSAKIRPYAYQDLLDLIAVNEQARGAWIQFLVLQNAFLSTLVAVTGEEVDSRQLQFETFAKGDTIIRQGDVASKVYSIVEGQAEAFVDQVKVGDINEEEIFGDMAMFAGTPRTATVIASRPCLVMAVAQEEFLTLVKSHPAMCMNLIEHMAKTIVELNSQISKAL